MPSPPELLPPPPCPSSLSLKVWLQVLCQNRLWLMVFSLQPLDIFSLGVLRELAWKNWPGFLGIANCQSEKPSGWGTTSGCCWHDFYAFFSIPDAQLRNGSSWILFWSSVSGTCRLMAELQILGVKIPDFTVALWGTFWEIDCWCCGWVMWFPLGEALQRFDKTDCSVSLASKFPKGWSSSRASNYCLQWYGMGD